MIFSNLESEIKTISKECINCNLCRKECDFLKEFGTPKAIADNYTADEEKWQEVAFYCSLCGLCRAVCPKRLNPVGLFLALRREAVGRGKQNFSHYKRLLSFEKRGTSRRYTWYGFPDGCDTVFFPGCSLPGIRPQKVMRLYDVLTNVFPGIGIVLDCCTKSSHDLGRTAFFEMMFNEMATYLEHSGIRRIIVACPNCYATFRQYGTRFNVNMFFEVLPSTGLFEKLDACRSVTLHDPCAVRFETGIHNAVRMMAAAQGIRIEEMAHRGWKTLCCGEGGAVASVASRFSDRWRKRCIHEANGRRIITYCAGCEGFLGRKGRVSHILDLFFEPQKVMTGRVNTVRPPLTYINRIVLKAVFKIKISAALSRERCFEGQ